MVKSLNKIDLTFKIRFLFKILLIVVRKIGYSVQYSSGKTCYSVQYMSGENGYLSNTSRGKWLLTTIWIIERIFIFLNTSPILMQFHLISRYLHSGFRLQDWILLKIRNFNMLTKNSLSPHLQALQASWEATSQLETWELSLNITNCMVRLSTRGLGISLYIF